jgi:hypothetical protein
MNYKTIAAALALACAGLYAAPAFAGPQVAFFDFNKKPVKSFATQAANFYNHDIYVHFDESDSYRRVMQSYTSNHNGNHNLFDSKFVPSYEGGGTNNITAPVPEPETYAMMVAGLLIIGFVARRRRMRG